MSKFKTVENKRIPELEADVLKFWKENKIFEKSVDQRSEKDLYVFYDGPPFVSGLPHYGHLLGSVAKDLIPRYWTMRGKRVERVWGWDAQGITVENSVQKELGIKHRRDIIEYGLEKFAKACQDYTMRISDQWVWYIDRIGRWVDMENAYRTSDQTYMESVMWAFKQLYEKDLIKEGVYTSLHCTTCGTPVSNFEIAMDNSYRDEEDPAVTMKFKVSSKGKFEGVNVLAWTTTPWTLPSNRALVVNKKEEYILVESDGEKYVVGKPLLKKVFEGKNYRMLEDIKGKDLVGLSYEPLYKIYKTNDKDLKIYHFDDMVHMEEGTGVVHSAPGFGEIDTEMGKENGLSMTMALNDDGKFAPGTDEENPYEGMFYKKADDLILEDLKERGLLFNLGKVTHRFPFHDRCGSLLVHRAQNSWFVDIEKVRGKLAKNNENINWIPAHLKEGRFGKNIEQAPDWCISRTRFWATPMPVWESEDGDRVVIGSIAELEEFSGKKVENLHRPFIDEITFEKGGREYKRRPEVLDSWFEAGSMPYAQLHYPFENEKKFKDNFPGDYIVEYVGQVRAWFHVMHVLSTAIFGKNSFKNVISTGTIMGNDGRKMSKTFKNYPDPKQVLESIGGDALRLYLMNSPLMAGEDMNVDEVEIKIKSRNVLNPLWNSLKFFLIYAEKHNWDPENSVESKNILDRWITARLHEATKVFVEEIEKYQVPFAIQALENFVDDLSRWYVRRSRDRISSGDNEALSTMYNVLYTFSKVAAPAIPFIVESIYKELAKDDDPESIHLCEYPDFDEKYLKKNKEVLESMVVDREIVSAALSARDFENLPIRQPLQDFTSNKKVSYEEIVKAEVNVKEVKFDESMEEIVKLNTEITEELELERMFREMVRKFQSLRKNQGLNVGDKITAIYEQGEKNEKVVEKFGNELKETIGATKLTAGTEYEITREN